MTTVRPSDVAVLPEPGDNVAIVSRTLEPGTQIKIGADRVRLGHVVLEGHRIVTRPIAEGEPLLSWSVPFSRALRDLHVGDYVCTAGSLETLRSRGVTPLPAEPAARNEPLDPYRLDEAALRVSAQVSLVDEPGTFLGFSREQRVAGTRNHIVVVGVTSSVGAFVTQLAHRFDGDIRSGFDGVVPVAHTEGGKAGQQNNLDFLLTVLSGFLIHPNVGAVLVVDEPGAAITSAQLAEFMRARGYPPLRTPHAFFTRRGSFTDDLSAAAGIVTSWIGPVGAQTRTEQPLTNLRIALQCGGSDAFSGITANPLAAAVARDVIRHGGAAVLAETPELIGAEHYVLDNVRTPEVAQRFLAAVESFKERLSWHGHTAEGNPSGGNLYRGLYNVVLKSVGAARKMDRQVRLDHVVGYGEPLPGPGFTFMDSPGNDLESVAGQVASGCNLIFFTTGNGSITNFPFVPTIKFVSTTTRYEQLSHDMDVDAGRYLTGTPINDLTTEVFDLTTRTASGERTVGERAGHSQVSIWRDWRQTTPRPGLAVSIDGRSSAPQNAREADRDALLHGKPLPARPHRPLAPHDAQLTAWEADGRTAPEHVALILPTSLCSGQISLQLAAQANDQRWLADTVTRFVALPHTEGCGVSSGPSEHTYTRTMIGYLTHPNVRLALLLEHGCEKTTNDYFRAQLTQAGADPADFGWASIQRDGGLKAVGQRVRTWFEQCAATLEPPRPIPTHLGTVAIGLGARGQGAIPTPTTVALARLGTRITTAGESVLLSSADPMLDDEVFRREAFGSTAPVAPTLAYGQQPAAPGWHVMRMPTTDWMETATGLGAGGTQLLLIHVRGDVIPSHRLVPVVQVSADRTTIKATGADLDTTLDGTTDEQAAQALDILAAVYSGQHTPHGLAASNVGFQVTRGMLGVSV